MENLLTSFLHALNTGQFTQINQQNKKTPDFTCLINQFTENSKEKLSFNLHKMNRLFTPHQSPLHIEEISVDSFFQLPRWQNRFSTLVLLLFYYFFLLCGSGCNRLFFYVLWWRVFLKQNKYIFHRRQKRNNVDTIERKASYVWSYIGRINRKKKKKRFRQLASNKRRQSDELLSYFIMIRKKPHKSAGREHKFLIWNLFVFHPNIIMANGMLSLVIRGTLQFG